MKRDYTRDLIHSFASSCHVRLVGSPELAGIAEARMRGEPVDRAVIMTQIGPCFLEVESKRSDIVVLACTHYPFLTDIFREMSPWPVQWLDPAPAIARRLVSVLEGREAELGAESEAVFHQRPASPGTAGQADGGLRPGATAGIAIQGLTAAAAVHT
jgi:glutamate racemase